MRSFLRCFTWYIIIAKLKLSTITFLNEGSHPLPSQLPEEHAGHKAASMKFLIAHYTSTHCHCWYSFYLSTEELRVESIPSQVTSGVSGY